MTALAHQLHPAPGVTPEQLAAALVEHFSFQRKPERHLLASLLDAPEQTLLRNGLLLWEEQEESAHRLVLSDLWERETPCILALTAGRPKSAGTIPFRPLREKLEPLLGSSPIKTLLTLEVRRHTLRLLNALQRAVLRVDIDLALLPQSGEHPALPLPPRIRLQQLRDDPAPVLEVLGFLRSQRLAVDAELPLPVEALNTLGRELPTLPTPPPEPPAIQVRAPVAPEPPAEIPPVVAPAPRGAMHIVGVYNIKGGVGKTATAVNLAWLAAQEGYRTLVWDLDPQAAATFYFRVLPGVEGGSGSLVGGKSALDTLIRHTDYANLDLLPSDFSYRTMDFDLDQAAKPAKQLLKLLRPLSQRYDYLFLDCPPNVSLVSENVFRAADALLIPTIPTTLSQRTLQQLLEFLQGHGLDVVKLLPFFSMVDRRKALHLRMLEDLPQLYREMLRTPIPYASDIERMGVHRAPIFTYARRSPGAHAYEALWQEIKGRLGY